MNLSDLTNMIQNSNGKEMSNVEFNGVVTGMFKDGESVIYHTDIYYALREVLFNKKPNIFEFD